MSRINGDKSRSAIAHKRGVHRRAKIKQLLEARKNQSSQSSQSSQSGQSGQSSGKAATPSGERPAPRTRS